MNAVRETIRIPRHWPAGIQSHGRSLLVWPTELSNSGIALLREVAPLGARFVVLGDRGTAAALDVWPGEPQLTELHVFTGARPADFAAAPKALSDGMVVALQRACGLTPLPANVLDDDFGWTHSAVVEGDTPVAWASAQHLDRVVPGTSASVLVCAVAVHPNARGRGLGRSVVAGALRRPPTQPAAALVVAGDEAALRFFNALGWRDVGPTAVVGRWE
jgi:GNAT superfamily N-acetyltransferase